MKSSKNDLMKRGMIDENYLDIFSNFNQEDLLNLLSSSNPSNRTAAARLLSVNFNVNDEVIYSSLVKALITESALYTKIEISKSLEKGDVSVAEYMLDYLAIIGNNQHKKLPKKVSKKKSYPLPRDIIARILGKMDKSNFSVLLYGLNYCNENQISELLDSIGFMVFYNPSLAILDNFKPIIQILSRYVDNYIIVWKIVMVLSAFTLDESVFTLNQIKYKYNGVNLIILETERSLSFINGDLV